MDQNINPSSAPPKRPSRLFKTISKVIHKADAKNENTNSSSLKCCSWPQNHPQDGTFPKTSPFRSTAALHAFFAKLFASISSIKAAYAELQTAQYPYNGELIQTADEAVVNELKQLSELKRSYLKKQIDINPQVTFLLAEFQEQQSLMKTYEITLKKLELEERNKDSEIARLKKKKQESLERNKIMEKKLNESGVLSILYGVDFKDLSFNHFNQVLQFVLRSVNSFVKVMVKEMENAKWDLSLAVKAIHPKSNFVKPSHRTYAFESFVCSVMFDDFSHCSSKMTCEDRRACFEEFKNLRSVNPKVFLSQNPKSPLGKFLKSKYLNLVHPKMECSIFGNLNQRSSVSNGQCPESAFFTAFAEMGKRVWVLKLLGMSLHGEVSAFRVGRGCRFSEVYMESVTEEVFDCSDGEVRVGFTVVPGFKAGEMIIAQSQVYLCPTREKTR